MTAALTQTVAKDLSERLKLNEDTLAEKIGKVVSEAFFKQLTVIFPKKEEKKEEKEGLLTSLKKNLFEDPKKLLPDSKEEKEEKGPSLLASLKNYFLGDSKKEKETQEEKKKEPGLFENLLDTLSGLKKVVTEEFSSTPTSLLEKEDTKPQDVIVTGFSQQSLETLSSILPEAIIKGTQTINDSLTQMLEKFDKLLEAVKELDMSGDDGGGFNPLDILPIGRGRRGGKARGRNTRQRNKKARELRKQRQAQREAKGPKGVPSSKPTGGSGKAMDKIGKVTRNLGKGVGGTVLKGLGAAGAILGAGLEFSNRKAEGQTNVQAGVGTAGTAAGAGLGAWGGAATGAAIGSIIPGVGTVIGGVVGGLVGGIGGAWLGGSAADKLTGVERDQKIAELSQSWKNEQLAGGSGGLTNPLGPQYIQTYENLTEDKKKEIDKILLEKWEKDPKSTNETILKKLQETNPQLQYGDKISPALTEPLDKALEPQTPTITITKENQPTISPSIPNVSNQIGQPTTPLSKQLPESATKTAEKPKLVEAGFSGIGTGLLNSAKNIFGFGKKQEENLPASTSQTNNLTSNQEYLDDGPNIIEPEQPESKFDTLATTALPLGAAAFSARTIGEDQQPEAKPDTLAPILPTNNIQPNQPPQSGKISKQKGFLSMLGTAATTALPLGAAALAAGKVGGKVSNFVSNLFAPKEEQPEAKPDTLAPVSSVTSSTISPEQFAGSTTNIENNNNTSSVSTIGEQVPKDESLLKSIAENTKNTSDQVSKLTDAFSIFSKMLPGMLLNTTSKSENRTPLVLNESSNNQNSNSVRSVEIAKAGNSTIQDFRSFIESSRPIPA